MIIALGVVKAKPPVYCSHCCFVQTRSYLYLLAYDVALFFKAAECGQRLQHPYIFGYIRLVTSYFQKFIL